jgi:hypothetical protein
LNGLTIEKTKEEVASNSNKKRKNVQTLLVVIFPLIPLKILCSVFFLLIPLPLLTMNRIAREILRTFGLPLDYLKN